MNKFIFINALSIKCFVFPQPAVFVSDLIYTGFTDYVKSFAQNARLSCEYYRFFHNTLNR